MKHFLRKTKSIFALVLAAVLCMSMPTTAFAAENSAATENEISVVLDRINAEYGTNIRILTESELSKYGLDSSTQAERAPYEAVDLEETLRYIAEVQIPRFERTSQEAKATMATLPRDTAELKTIAGSQITAMKDIDYATAAVVAYDEGDTWGSIVESYCYTSISQSTYFMASSTSATHTNGRKTISWTGTGDYISNINGNHYYLYSGTQYASMNIADYT